MNILVTGAAGFIGFHLALFLLKKGKKVVGVDNINNYYSTSLKKDRLRILEKYKNFTFIKIDLKDKRSLQKVFKKHKPRIVINLAAQAGVRYSIENPYEYLYSNVEGFLNILECSKDLHVKHLIYASSSSVYGLNNELPFRPSDTTDHPAALYGATKKSNEIFAHSYSHLFSLPTTGLRFFTVYGPWGRPDMALFKFVDNIYNGREIEIYNNGNMSRDFTYVADIVESIYRLISFPPKASSLTAKRNFQSNFSSAPYRIFNIGNSAPVNLLSFVHEIEKVTGIEAKKKFLPMQAGDVSNTSAFTDDLYKLIGFRPKTSIEEGIHSFVRWYKSYYRKDK